MLDQREAVQSPALVLAFAEFWFRSLLAIDTWHQQPNIRRILDVICHAVFFVNGGRAMLQEHLKAQYRRLQLAVASKGKGVMASFASMFSRESEPVLMLSIAEPGKTAQLVSLLFFICEL